MLDEQLLLGRLRAFQPEPLIDTAESEEDDCVEIPMVHEDANNIDLAKVNYLDVLNNEEIKKSSEAIIREYGVGTCGPRAFYGTTDVHLELEERLAEFLHMELSIVYSYGFVAISSSIAAYCKRTDVVFIDEHANFPIMQGLTAAKSKLVHFRHNDAASFRAAVAEIDAQVKKKRKSRKFLIVEGISWATGQLCPLPAFVEIAEQYKIRVFVEETHTFGIFGATGRGLTEFYDIDPNRIDMVFGTLEGAIGSIGGFCAGSHACIEHQRLNGSGYIFSASLPTYQAKVVLKSLELMADKPRKLAQLTGSFHEFLQEQCDWEVVSDRSAPFQLFTTGNSDFDAKIHGFCKEQGVHFIKRDRGLLINLNVALLDQKDKLERIHQVLLKAAELYRN